MTQPDHNDIHSIDGISENRSTRPPLYFTLLFGGLIAWGVLFAGYYLFGSWSSEAEFREKQGEFERLRAAAVPAVASDRAQTAGDGRGIFAEHCAGCHGEDGKGGIGPDLTGDYGSGRSPEAVIATISKGLEGGMPAFERQLSPPQIKAVATYVLSLK